MAAVGEKQMAVDILARHGITNTWCSHPTADIPAHSSSNRWKAGDHFFETEVTLAYRLGDGEEVQVFARARGRPVSGRGLRVAESGAPVRLRSQGHWRVGPALGCDLQGVPVLGRPATRVEATGARTGSRPHVLSMGSFLRTRTGTGRRWSSRLRSEPAAQICLNGGASSLACQ